MRRRMLLGAGAMAVAAGGFALWPREIEPFRVTRENALRAHLHMSRSEAEAILGPPGDYRTGPTSTSIQLRIEDSYVLNGQRGWFSPPTTHVAWEGDTVTFRVGLDAGDRVVEMEYADAERVEQTPLDDLLWRAKRRWQKFFPGP